MNKIKIHPKELLALGYPECSAISESLKVLEHFPETFTKKEILENFSELLLAPEKYLEDTLLNKVATALVAWNKAEVIPLKEPVPFAIYGEAHIEEGALRQMETAVRLPVAVAGALMPDAHFVYGLPIGGVLATKNAVIPYGVGVDIGCRMCLTIYDIPAEHFVTNENKYKRELIAYTKFGAGAGWHGREKADHEVLERDTFKSIEVIKRLHDKAYTQLGSSGGGNHFVEWGLMEFAENDAELNIPKGTYVALLSHSGSRGLGATIAGHYTKVAKEICRLPKEAAHLAYMDLNSAEGMEYWLAMNLAGDYASACHHVIHERLTKAIGGTVLARVEN